MESPVLGTEYCRVLLIGKHGFNPGHDPVSKEYPTLQAKKTDDIVNYVLQPEFRAVFVNRLSTKKGAGPTTPVRAYCFGYVILNETVYSLRTQPFIMLRGNFLMKKSYIADFIGTMALVIFGCGTAMLVGCNAAAGSGYLLTALAFGLTIVGMAYCIGNVSGCHINPSVSLGVLFTGGMSIADFVGYVIAQCLGALAAIFKLGHVADMTGGFGSNGLAGVGGSAVAGLAVEVVLAFFFVLTILGVISQKASHGSFAGLVIGLTLVLIHILGIGLTGTSVNPARSFGPAIAALLTGNAAPVAALWVFIVGPLVGGALAAIIWRFFSAE